ncbi:putative acyl-lipid (11-3)-desaturase [Helianthus anomalus]
MFEKKGHGIHMLSGAILGLAWMQIAYLGHDAGQYQMIVTRGWKSFPEYLSGIV